MNKEISNQISEFCYRISDDIIDVIHEKHSDTVGRDDFLYTEAASRVSSSVQPNTVKGLYYDIPEVLLEYADSLDEISDLSVTVAVYLTGSECSVSADNTPVDCSPVGMHINVFLPENKELVTEENLDFVFTEIANSVRHEFEHVIQEEFSDFVHNVDYHKIDFKQPREELSNMAYYLTQPCEVSAHVHGYYQVSSSERDFYASILKLLSSYVELDYISKDEKLRIFLCWKDWFERNIYTCNSGGEAQCAK